jgi:hypothetical protein
MILSRFLRAFYCEKQMGEKGVFNLDEMNKKRTPDFTNDGVAVWVNKTKNGYDYLSIKIVGHNVINAFGKSFDVALKQYLNGGASDGEKDSSSDKNL